MYVYFWETALETFPSLKTVRKNIYTLLTTCMEYDRFMKFICNKVPFGNKTKNE